MTRKETHFMGYTISEILSVCAQIKCPNCGEQLFKIYVAPKGTHMLLQCFWCEEFLDWKIVEQATKIMELNK